MSFQINIPSLSIREAIVDSLYRCVLGFDTADTNLFDSAFHQDATFEINDQVMTGLSAIHTGCYDNVSKLDTTHFLSNIRVTLTDGSETKATVTASALAQHYRPGQGNEPDTSRLLSGSLYFVGVEKDEKEGLWKIRSFKMKLVWTEGDWGVITGN
ncbi:hypothetical protein BO71DRAFT_400126 [Aspergillus ellipticus CBS 707.79]|uniref:SnoaL-like domain-containing protein n=1 Tax=Aspergillus ellipticus CBS 707.79 TaxID=1448320 RepID=A0A319DXM4_9EURO|nr:hypothetical protein BO71DRAFT_400126 [Aspergillus ellipticus CBS 707.79]